MKRVAIILMILIFGIGTASADVIGGKLHWGRKSKDCSGFGVCGFSVTIVGFEFYWGDVKGTMPPNAVGVQTSIDESRNTYTMTFSIKELEQKNLTRAADLGKEKFYLDEDIPFSKDANKAYGLKRTTPFTLKAGAYDIRKNGDTATVVIDIK